MTEAASQAARGKLLFRDFLRANDTARDAWSDFKQRLAAMTSDIYQYGQAKGFARAGMVICVGCAER